ncbi:hypothetical protein, partial [Capnocytophaga catalasegens]
NKVLRQDIGDNNTKYFIHKTGKIQYIKGSSNKYEYYVEKRLDTFELLYTLEKNQYGMVKIPDSGIGFNRYGTIDAGGTATNEVVGKGDRYLLPDTAAALFGIINEVAEKGWEIHLGDMSSENGSDPWQKGSFHHAGHGHLGRRKGLDVDFRYLNNSGVSYQGTHSSSAFDKNKNKTIFQLAYKYGFRKNYCTNAFSVFGEKILGVVDVGNHADHGHLGLTNIDLQTITENNISNIKIIN